MRRHLLIALGLVLASAGCRVNWSLGPPAIPGSGRIAEETRELPEFTAVEVGHAIRGSIDPGEIPSIQVRGDDNLLPLVVTEVRDGRLVVRVQTPDGAGISPSEPIQVVVTTPALHEIEAHGATEVHANAAPVPTFLAEVHGASRLTVEGLDVESLAVKAHGASTLVLRGKTGSLDADVSGASTVEAAELAADSAALEVGGASRIEARSAKLALGKVSGASKATILGEPAERDVESSGASTVTYR